MDGVHTLGVKYLPHYRSSRQYMSPRNGYKCTGSRANSTSLIGIVAINNRLCTGSVRRQAQAHPGRPEHNSNRYLVIDLPSLTEYELGSNRYIDPFSSHSASYKNGDKQQAVPSQGTSPPRMSIQGYHRYIGETGVSTLLETTYMAASNINHTLRARAPRYRYTS